MRWVASLGLAKGELSVEGATEYDPHFRASMEQIVAEYPEVLGLNAKFDGPPIPVEELVSSSAPKISEIYWLHGTSSNALPSIWTVGLLPRADTGSTPAFVGGAAESRPEYVYLTTQRNMARMAARAAAKAHGGRPVVLRIAPLPVSRMEPDEDSGVATAEQSLWRIGSIAYRGGIGPSRIAVDEALEEGDWAASNQNPTGPRRNPGNPLSVLLEAGDPIAQAEVLRAWSRDDPSELFNTIRVPGRSIRYIRWDDLIESLKDGDEEALDTMRAIMRAARGEGQVVEDEPEAPELDGVELEWGQRLEDLDPESKLILYHGTSSLFLPEILERGLVPSSAAGHTSNVGSSGFSEPSDAVFLSADYGPGPATAEFYARNAARRHGGEPIVLTVVVPVDRLEYDPDDEDLPSGRRQFIADYVHPSEIVED